MDLFTRNLDLLHANHKGTDHSVNPCHLISAGLILDQNDDGPFSNTCKFPNFKGPFEILKGPLQNLMGPRILNIHIRA